MWHRFNRWWSKQPKVWAVREFGDLRWVKVVAHQKPYVVLENMRRGPFRSEIDCDEFCASANEPYAMYVARAIQRAQRGEAC